MNKYLKCIKSCEHKNSRNSRKFDRDFIEKIASTNCREQAYQKKVASTNTLGKRKWSVPRYVVATTFLAIFQYKTAICMTMVEGEGIVGLSYNYTDMSREVSPFHFQALIII